MIYFYSYKQSGFTLDITRGIRRINGLVVRSHATGQVIIGGGVVKHHMCNAKVMRYGTDSSVYVNTRQEFDGSDSGESPREAISGGRKRPLIVCQTLAQDVHIWRETARDCICWIDDASSEVSSSARSSKFMGMG